MAQFEVLLPLQEITVDRAELLAIQRNDLVPLLNDQYRLNHYADLGDSSAVSFIGWGRSHI